MTIDSGLEEAARLVATAAADCLWQALASVDDGRLIDAIDNLRHALGLASLENVPARKMVRSNASSPITHCTPGVSYEGQEHHIQGNRIEP